MILPQHRVICAIAGVVAPGKVPGVTSAGKAGWKEVISAFCDLVPGGDICGQGRLCLMPPETVASGICGSKDGKSAGMTGPNAPYGQMP